MISHMNKLRSHEDALKKLAEGTVIPAIPLALDINRKHDEYRQRKVIRYYLNAGVGGIAAAVHTTQFAIRDPQIGLYEPVLKIVSEEIDDYENSTGNVIVRIAGVCGSVEQAVGEAKIAKKLGYDAVLLSPGGLQDISEDEMIKRTVIVADIIPVIGFYLQPAAGGRIFSFNYWKRLCEIDNVIAIKSAPFNRYQTLDVVRAAAISSRSHEITLYTGNDDNIVIDLLTKYSFIENGKTYVKGFSGGLLGHWAVWTNKAVKMFDEIKVAANKNYVSPEILTLAAQVTDSNAAFFDSANNFEGCIAGIHEVLRRQGILEGIWCLNPKETLSPGQNEAIDRVYNMYPHLNDDQFVKDNLHKW